MVLIKMKQVSGVVTVGQYQSYIICATPRSGSTLLCTLLAATGVAGNPNSFFRTESLSVWTQEWGLPDIKALSGPAITRRYLAALRIEGTAQTGLFGLRLMAENIVDASNALDQIHPGHPNDHARFEAAFGKTLYLHLSRQDKVAQAVSRIKAEQSGLWHMAPDGSEYERLSPAKPLAYDAKRIARTIAQYRASDAAWQAWFAAQGITPMRLTYEGLAAAPFETLKDILRQLGQSPGAADGIVPGVARMTDDTSKDWIARYRHEFPGA